MVYPANEAPSAAPNRILWNERGGCIDEIVVHNATVHIEQMDDNCWWLGITLPDGTYWMGNLATKRAPMQFTEQESDLVWDQDETHEVRQVCAFVWPSRKRCKNTATHGKYCDMHQEDEG